METPDFGPIYAETNWNAVIREPFNALTAAVYIVLAIIWLIRIHPLRAEHRFLYVSMWVLLVGGVGGTIYHALRAHWVFLALDALPIAILAMATAIYAIRRLTRRWLWLFAPIAAAVGVRVTLAYWLPKTMAINAGYAVVGVLMLAPVVLLALRAHHGLWTRLVPGAGLFALALTCRAYDFEAGSSFPLGTHGFWHLLAAGAVYLLIQFLWEVRDVTLESTSQHPRVDQALAQAERAR